MKERYFWGEGKYKIAFYVLLGLFAGVLFFILFGFLVKFLWNETIASMFSLTAITFWQALGLFVLAKLFFGFGIGGNGGSRGWSRRSRKKHGKRDEPNDAEPDTDNDAFRQFWEAEGKDAYAAFREGRAGDTSD